MALSAAELQKRHQLEGAPDPFPTLGGASPARPKTQSPAPTAATNTVDDSEDAFPSLGASSAPAPVKTKPAISAWASKPAAVKAGKKAAAPGGLGRVGQATAASHPFSDVFWIPANEIATGKVVQETMKKVQEQTGATVESSTQMSTGLKQFLVKASDQRRLTLARQIIERGLSKPVTIEVEIPITTIGTIIGPKGATLKSITDETGTKIDIPRRDTLPEWDARAARAEAEASGDYDSDEEIEEPQVTISISGTGAAAKDARERVLGLISHKVSQGTVSIKNIPSKYYPFISGPRGSNTRKLEEEFGNGDVKIHVPPPAVWKSIQDDDEDHTVEAPAKERDLSIKIKGDKEGIAAVKAEILRQFEDLVGSLKEFGIVVPKRQHRFLTGEAADDILEQTRCIIDLPPASDPNEQVMMRGPQTGLLKAIELAMSKAEAVAVETVDVVALARVHTSDALPHAKKVARYLQRSGQLKAIGNKFTGVNVYAPSSAAVESSGKVVIDVVGEDKNEVIKARDEVLAAVKAVPPTAITTVQIDPAVHSFLIGKKGAKISQFEQANRVTAVFPHADDDSSDVHVIYNAGDLPADKKARDSKLKEVLTAATAALHDLAKNAADVKSEVLDVEKKWHSALNRATVNALVGEDEAVTVRVGGKKDGEENTVVIRGPSTEVDRVVASIKQIVEDAKNDHIINGYTVEFDVDRKHLGHIVGSGGASVKKLRDALGVKVDFSDEAEGVAKGKKSLSKCTIVGRKEAVEEAKRRVLAQVEKLEDETTEVVKIKKELQPALIGSGGKYAIRLEEKYGVYLSFPREGKEQKPDEVIIRGGKKGVAAAKAELLEAAAYEAETRQEAKFTIPSKTIAQLVGKSGATIKGIKDETGAEIDIDREGADKDRTTVTVRGDKKAITAAKAAVLELTERIAEEVNISITIEPEYHRSIIGQGGRKLRDLIAAAGGPKEAREQTGLVQFPRQGDDKADQVRLRGRDAKLVQKIQELLEKEVEQLKNTVTVGVIVPAAQHAPKIGRGGSALQDLQRRTGAEIHFPGSRRYDSIGAVSNASELTDAEAGDIVKVVGSKEAVAKATEELATPAPERAQRRGGNAQNNLATRTVPIPTKYYHAIAGQQDLLRQFRAIGAYLTMPAAPAKPAHQRSDDLAAKTARIDLDSDETEGEWEVRENYIDAEEGDLDWVVKAKEEELDAAQAILDKAVVSAQSGSHVGLLTGLPRSAFPRIIGSKGATIARLRSETGADIHVGKEDDLITITGSLESVEKAREAILSIVSRQGSRF